VSAAGPSLLVTPPAGRLRYELIAGYLNHDAYLVFAMGGCWAMAEAVRRRTGWPIEMLGHQEHCLCDTACALPHWSHAVNVTPAGTLVDTSGPIDFEAKGWPHRWPLDRTIAEMAAACRFEPDDIEPMIELADLFVDAVTATTGRSSQ
jgi:hypothetical protein